MIRFISSVVLLFWFLPPLHSSDENESSGDHEKEKYREPDSWVHYKRFIDDALSHDDVSGCVDEGAACFFDVIDDDLKPWSDGISLEKFQSGLDRRSQTRAVHYQIIDHK